MKENNYALYTRDSHPIKRVLRLAICFTIVVLCVAGCTKLEPVVIVITATATQPPPNTLQEATLTPLPELVSVPTNIPSQNAIPTPTDETYVVQPGDTLSGIAAQFGVQLQTLLRINQIADPNILEVGQVITLPAAPTTTSPEFRIISDSHFVRGPGSQQFDINAFVNQQNGYIRTANDVVDEVSLTAADVVQRVAVEFSIDPRLLLAILQYRSQWLTQIQLDESLKQFPIQGKPSSDGIDRSGLYKQLSWAANQLNAGYYGWKYKGADVIEFDDGTRLRYASNINAGTVGIQYFFSLQSDYPSWGNAVSSEGVFKTYFTLFGDPLAGDANVLVPNQLQQPEIKFPFASGQTWYFTGGSHGGWGAGSAWAAIDFAPPDDRPDGSAPCYVSDYWATAVTSGVIARSGGGVVVLDLDGDGDETTGWTIMYLHMASDGRVPLGTQVKLGGQIGRPSCEGGFSNATHMHIARRYNGEWIPVSCDVCNSDKIPPPPFVMDGWTAIGLANQEYQGYMVKGSERRDAEQGRLTPVNRISW